MIKLALIRGHTKTAGGAYSPFLKANEYTWNGDLINKIIQLNGDRKDFLVKEFLRDGIGIAGAYKNAMNWKPSAIIEVHFNAANGKAQGTETLYNDSGDFKGINEVVFAKMINDGMVQALGTKDRGIRKRLPSDRGYGNVSQTKSIPSILIEIGFGDNKADCALMEKNKLVLANEILRSTQFFFKGKA